MSTFESISHKCDSYSFYSNISGSFHHDNYKNYWYAYVHDPSLWTMDLGFLNLCNFGSAIILLTFRDVDLIKDFLLEYWIEQVTVGHLYVKDVFLTRIFYRGVPCFAIHCPFGVWCHGLTTCLLYVSLLFGNAETGRILVWQDHFKF